MFLRISTDFSDTNTAPEEKSSAPAFVNSLPGA